MATNTVRRLLALLTLLLSTAAAVATTSPDGPSYNPKCRPGTSQWSGWGANVFNNRYIASNTEVTPATVASLSQHCLIAYPQGVSAAPAIVGGVAYYPTWNGSFVALDYVKCEVQWQVNVTDVIYKFGPVSDAQRTVAFQASRTSPQVDGDVVFFGTQTWALMVAVDRLTGAVLATHQVNAHPLALVTMSPTVWRHKIFVGTSSMEEGAAANVPDYPCCDFIGNFKCLTFDRAGKKFEEKWEILTLPPANGTTPTPWWSGGATWGSQPSIDAKRNQVFFGTGNTYQYPAEFARCLNQTAEGCLPADVLQEAVVAADIDTGHVNWANRLTPLDAWTVACGLPPSVGRNFTECPEEPGPDSDFGMAPTFVPAGSWDAAAAGRGGPLPHLQRDAVIVGQKNGMLYSLAAEDGSVVWSTLTNPGFFSGGLSWGLAADEARVYFTAINGAQADFRLAPSGQTITNSAWGAADLATGAVLWETPTPESSDAFGPPTVVGDVMFATRWGALNTTGPAAARGGLVALDKASGRILFDQDLDANARPGIAVQDDYVLLGTGYGLGFSGNGSFHVLRVTK